MEGPLRFSETKNVSAEDLDFEMRVTYENKEAPTVRAGISRYFTNESIGELDWQQEFLVPNYESFVYWQSLTQETPWLLSIRSLMQVSKMLTHDARPYYIYYQLMSNTYELAYLNESTFRTQRAEFLVQDGVSNASVSALWDDPHYGFSDFWNVLDWGELCDNEDPVGKATVAQYFLIPQEQMTQFLTSICNDWSNAESLIEHASCDFTPPRCDEFERAYFQWSNSSVTQAIVDASSVSKMNKTVFYGEPELSEYLNVAFMPNLKPDYVATFASVNFYSFGEDQINRGYAKLLSPYKEDEKLSLLNMQNMKELLDVGDTLPSVLTTDKTKPPGPASLADIDLSAFNNLTERMTNINNAQAYTLYYYVKNLIERTIVQVEKGGSLALTASAQLSAHMLKRELKFFEEDFTSMLVGAGLLVFTEDESCPSATARLFAQLRSSERLCDHNETDVTTLEGASFC